MRSSPALSHRRRRFDAGRAGDGGPDRRARSAPPSSACSPPGCWPRAPRSPRSRPSSPRTSTDRPCVAVNSGTSALLLALLALGIGRGDEVVVPSFSFAATANAVALTGARPGLRRHRARPLLPRPVGASRRRSPRAPRRSCRCTSTAIPRRWTGSATSPAGTGSRSSRTPPRPTSRRSTGARSAPSVTSAAFSFYPTKNMTAGEGGMVVCADEAVARTVRLLRNQGMERRYANEVVGYNMRMTDLHAAIGRVQLRRLPDWTAQRRRNAAFLGARSPARRRRTGVPQVAPGPSRCGTSTPSGSRDRDRLRDAPLAEQGWAPASTTRRRSTGSRRTGSTSTCRDRPRPPREVLSLPVHPALSPASSTTSSTRVNALAGGGDADAGTAARRPHRARARWAATTPACCGRCPTSSWWRPSTPGDQVREDVAGARRRSARSTSSSTGASTCASSPPPPSPTRTIALQLAEAGVATLDREAAGPRRQGGPDDRRGLRAHRRAGLRRAHRAVQPGAAGHAAPLGRGRARRALPGRHPPAGARSRPASPTPASSWTWPPTTSTSRRG